MSKYYTEEWFRFLTSWHRQFGESKVTSSDLLDLIVKIKFPDDVFSLPKKQMQLTTLGFAINKLKNRVIGGLRIVSAGAANGRKRYAVLAVDLPDGPIHQLKRLRRGNALNIPQVSTQIAARIDQARHPTSKTDGPVMHELPKLLEVECLESLWGLSRHEAYAAVKQMPPGVVVRLGRRIRLNEARLAKWINAGGSLVGIQDESAVPDNFSLTTPDLGPYAEFISLASEDE